MQCWCQLKQVMFINFFLLSLLALSIAQEEEKRCNVLKLNDHNFDVALSHKHLLVTFYAPWCRFSIEFAPQFAKAADILKEEDCNLVFAKVDATAENAAELKKRYEIKKYPTIKYFKNGKILPYGGRRKTDTLLKWWREVAAADGMTC